MIFDIEADGLNATRIHVMAYTSGSEVKYTHDYDKMRKLLLEAKVLIGHSIIRYDIPTLERILEIDIGAQLIDTLALSWYLNPKRLVHGLDSFGKDFGIEKPKIDDWDNLSQEEYRHRCIEDVKINRALWKSLKDKLLTIYDTKEQADKLIKYLSFKLDCARLQEESGWKLDVKRAKANQEELFKLQEEKVAELIKHMPLVKKFKKQVKPKKPFKKDGTYSVVGAKWFQTLKQNNLPEDYDGIVEVFDKEEEPNPNSHEQIKDWLFSLGWEPQTFDYKRNPDTLEERAIPQIRFENEDGIKELCPSVLKLAEKEPGIKVLEGLSIIQHRLAIFNGFLENEVDGRVTAEISGFTNTLRFKHKVLVNLPSVHKPWGEEIRGCLIADEGTVHCGSDMAGIEDATKRHYMFEHDPEFVKTMSKPGFDPHLFLAESNGKITKQEAEDYKNKVEGARDLSVLRKNFKVTNYSATYGVKPPKLSRTAGVSLKEAKELLDAFWKLNWSIAKVAEECKVKYLGDEMWLLNPVSGFYHSLRFEKDRFSTLNQSTATFCFDLWLRYILSKRRQLNGQFHDEFILTIKEGAEKKCEELIRWAIDKVNNRLKLNVQLDVDVQFGKTYADIH